MANDRWGDDDRHRWDEDRERHRREGPGGEGPGHRGAYGQNYSEHGYGRQNYGGQHHESEDRSGWGYGRGGAERQGAGRSEEYARHDRDDYGYSGRGQRSRDDGPQSYRGRDYGASGNYGGGSGRDYGGGYSGDHWNRDYRATSSSRGEGWSGSNRGYGGGYGSSNYSEPSRDSARGYGDRGYSDKVSRESRYPDQGDRYRSSSYSDSWRNRDWPERGDYGSSTSGYGDTGPRYGSDFDRDRYSRQRAANESRGPDYDDVASEAWSAGLVEWPAPIADWRGGYSGSDYGRRSNRQGSAGYREDWRRARNPREASRNEWRGSSERGWWDRTKDEVRAWMGDEEAENRRRADEAQRESHFGRGPRGYTRSDARVLEDVNDRLTEDWRVDASEIEVTVVSGEVTLSGTVESRETKRRAENVAADVSGVRDVQNNLRVRPQTQTGYTSGNLTGSSSAALEQTTGSSSGTPVASKTTQPKH